MAELASAYALAAPHLAAPSEAAEIPAAAWKSHRVVWVDNALIMPRGSIASRTFCLMEPEWAARKVAAGEARYETDQERQMALDNGHQRFVGGPPKRKAPKGRDAKGGGDGDS